MRTEGQACQRARKAKVFARAKRQGLCLLPPIPSQQVQRQTKPFPMGPASARELQHVPSTWAVKMPKPALVRNHGRSCRRCNESRPGRQCGHGRHGRHCQARHGYKICRAKTCGISKSRTSHVELTALRPTESNSPAPARQPAEQDGAMLQYNSKSLESGCMTCK